MKHFETGDWADFARNMTSAEQKAEMQAHLEAGCEECRDMLAFLQRVAEAGASEASYESESSELASSAKAIFGAVPAARWTDRLIEALQVLVAALTYDSAVGPQPVGARAHRAASRQMLYEAGEFCLDLRFDRERDSMQVVLVGQVANPKNPNFRVAKLPVLILSGKKVITQTASNEFGEFSLEYTPRSNLRLCVPVTDAGVRLEVPLKRFLEEV